MRILNFSLDTQVAKQGSDAALRICAYGALVDTYDVLVPSRTKEIVQLSERVRVFSSGGTFKLLQFIRMYRLAKQIIDEKRITVITVQDPYFIGVLAVALARRFRIGLEVQVHGFEKLTFVRRIVARYVLSCAQSVRVPSVRMAERLKHEFGVPGDRTAIVPVYVDIAKLEALRNDMSGSQTFRACEETFRQRYGDRFNVLTVSRLVPIKNISLQLESIALLITTIPSLTLHIVGDGPLFPALQKEIAARGLTEHVVLHGRKEGVALWVLYNSCDAFTLTSLYEGWGMVVVEAAVAGLPIVMTDVGCAGEFVIHEKSALIVPTSNLHAFTEALRRIGTESLLRSMLIEGGYAALRTLPTYEETMRRYLSSWQRAEKRV